MRDGGRRGVRAAASWFDSLTMTLSVRVAFAPRYEFLVLSLSKDEAPHPPLNPVATR